MDIYMFKGAFLCSDCGVMAQSLLMNKASDDSDEYPQGPYNSHFQELDSPYHCDSCGDFLEVNLTDDGREYVRESIKQNPQGPVSKIWADYYNIE